MINLQNSLQSIFTDKLLQDDRDPVVVFSFHGDRYGVFVPNVAYWNQAIVILLIQTVLQFLFGAITFWLVVKRRNKTPFLSFLAGYAFILPVALSIPYLLIEWLDIQNVCLKFSNSAVGLVVMFRVMEAMYDTSPPFVESSLGNYVAYYSSLSHFEWDTTTGQRRPITRRELMQSLQRFFSYLMAYSLLLSIVMHFDFQPFGRSLPLESFSFGWHLLDPVHLANMYVLVLLTFFFIALAFHAPSISENLKGFATQPVFHNPLWTSRSPREFWGRNWNLTIHRSLQQAAYRPARKYFSRPVATLLTFVASGIVHEYSWSVTFYNRHVMDESGDCISNVPCYKPHSFKLIAFFTWCGMSVLLQELLEPCFAFTKCWPTPVVCTVMIVTLGLPVAHWFLGDWAVGGNFSGIATGLLHIRKLS